MSFDVEHHLCLAVGFRWGIVVDAAVAALGDLSGRDPRCISSSAIGLISADGVPILT